MDTFLTTDSQEGGDSEGAVVTGAHEDNNPLTSDTNSESLNNEDRGGKVYKLQSLCALEVKF